MWFVLFLWSYTNADAPVQSCGSRRPRPTPLCPQRRFTVNYAFIYFLLGHKYRDMPAGEHSCYCGWWKLSLFCGEICDESIITLFGPSLLNALPIRDCQSYKSSGFQSLFWMFSDSLSSVYWWFRDSTCLFVLDRTPHWTSLCSAVCTERSEVRCSSRTASLELRYILNPVQGHFSVPDTHWHNSLNKAEQ